MMTGRADDLRAGSGDGGDSGERQRWEAEAPHALSLLVMCRSRDMGHVGRDSLLAFG